MKRKWLSLAILFCLGAIAVVLGTSQPHQPTVNQVTTSFVDLVAIVPKTVVGKKGFFQVGQSTKGRWWLIDPEGKPFLYKGVAAVGDGRGIPPTTSPLSSYSEIIKKKYGQDVAKFREDTLKQLRDWNFNALGTWTASDFWDQGMPYTIVLDFVKVGPKIEGMRLPDVFAPEWLEAINAKVQELVVPRSDSKMLVGYFTDNELSWRDFDARDRRSQFRMDSLISDRVQPSLLQVCLSLDETKPAYVAAWDFVLKRHGDSLEQLGRDWQINIPSPAAIKQLTEAKQAIVSPRFFIDQRLFTEEFAQRYFKLAAETIRRYDKNHLLLGCRFGAPPGRAVFSAVKRPWVDVVSFNNYRYALYERMDIYHQATNLPVLLTEFSWGSSKFSQRTLPEEPKGGLPELERMVRNGEKALARALTHPGLVGYTWYRWIDRPGNKPTNVPRVGLITIKNEPNPWNTRAIAEFNAKAEAIATTEFSYPL